MAKRKMSENSLKNLEKSKGIFAVDKELARKAKQKSDEKKKENKTLAQLLLIALSLPNEETGETNEIAITNAVIKRAINGDVSAYTTIRDTIGQKPKDVVENINPPVINISGIKKI